MTTANIVQYSREISHVRSTSNSDLSDYQMQQDSSVEHGGQIKIKSQLHYQRFRYDIEKRTGKKRRPHCLAELVLTNIPAPSELKIFCIDAHNDGIAHPNALIGQSCSNGIYTHAKFRSHIISKTVSIPYLQIKRVKSKECIRELTQRLQHLPSLFNGVVDMKYKFDTKMVRLCIYIEVEQTLLITSLSSIIRCEREGAKIKILRLSHVSVSVRGTTKQNDPIFIFTREDAPELDAGDYEVCLEERNDSGVCLWRSPIFHPKKADILYKHVIQYPVPEYKNRNTEIDVNVILRLRCISTEETDEVDFCYTVDSDLGMMNMKKRKAEVLSDRRRRLCIPSSDFESETPGKLLRLSPEPDVKKKLKGKLVRNGTLDNGASQLKMTPLLPEGDERVYEDTSSQDISGTGNIPDYLETDIVFETNSIHPTNSGIPLTNNGIPPTNSGIPPTNSGIPPTNSGISSTMDSIPPTNSRIPSTMGSIPPTNNSIPSTMGSIPPTNNSVPSTVCSIPSQIRGKNKDCMVFLKTELAEENHECLPVKISPQEVTELPLDHGTIHIQSYTLPLIPEACPNTLLTRLDKKCSAHHTRSQMLDMSSNSQPSMEAATILHDSEVIEASARRSDKYEMNGPMHDAKQATSTKTELPSICNEAATTSSTEPNSTSSVLHKSAIPSSSEMSYPSLPSIDMSSIGNLSSMDLFKVFSPLASLINNPEVEESHFEQNLNH